MCRSTEQDLSPECFVVGVFRNLCQDVNIQTAVLRLAENIEW